MCLDRAQPPDHEVERMRGVETDDEVDEIRPVEAHRLVGVGTREHGIGPRVRDFLAGVREVRFGLERVIDAVVTCTEQLVVIHLRRVVAKMRTARGFDESVRHQRAG